METEQSFLTFRSTNKQSLRHESPKTRLFHDCSGERLKFITGNALARVQWVNEPTDLWDITFCNHWFWGFQYYVHPLILRLRVLFYRRELWASKFAGFNSTKSLKICGRKRLCLKELRVCAPPAPMLTHSLLKNPWVQVNRDYLLKKLHKWRHLSKSASSQKVKQQKPLITTQFSVLTAFSMLWFRSFAKNIYYCDTK